VYKRQIETGLKRSSTLIYSVEGDRGPVTLDKYWNHRELPPVSFAEGGLNSSSHWARRGVEGKRAQAIAEGGTGKSIGAWKIAE